MTDSDGSEASDKDRLLQIKLANAVYYSYTTAHKIWANIFLFR